MANRARKYGALAAGAAVMIIAATAVHFYSARFGTTPAFRNSTGGIIRGSVAEMHRINLGGVEQSVIIRGRSASAPILIWLHGGPGTDETGMWRHYNAALEDHFLVIYWTQRGTGRSYDPAILVKSMNLNQFVQDLDQLIGILQTRFHQKKVVLVGHSWGTNIGVAYAQAHPQNVAAYVGIGQIGDAAVGEKLSYDYAFSEAVRRRDPEGIAALTKIGAPPYPVSSMLVEREWLEKYGGMTHRPMPLTQMIRVSLEASEATWYDIYRFQRGVDFSTNTLQPQVTKFNWFRDATRFQMPVFILAGRFDHNTDGQHARAYFEKLNAPFKQFRWFEESAHSPPFEEPDAFNRYMIEAVLPAIITSKR